MPVQPGSEAYCWVVKSSWRLAKITAYLVSISRLLCLAFLYGWRFLNKISLDWPLTLTTQPSTSKLSDNPATGAVRLFIDPRDLNLAINRPQYPMKTIDEVASHL